MVFVNVSRLRWFIAMSVLAMMMAGFWMPAATAGEATPAADPSLQSGADDATKEEPADAGNAAATIAPTQGQPEQSEETDPSVMTAAEVISTTLLITLSDASGEEFAFPAGQQICLSVTVTPNAGGAPLVLGLCRSESSTVPYLSGGMPDPNTHAYVVTLVSNTTSCTGITIPPVVATDYGDGAWYAIFHISMTCPDAPPPPTAIPTAPTYDWLRINYVNDGAPADLPGIVCFRITVDPIVPRAPFDTCTRTATFSYAWIGTVTTPLPVAATYTAAENRNESGCVGSPQPLRDVTADDGSLIAEIDVLIRCGPAGPTSYAGVSIELVDSSGADRVYAGEICPDLVIAPASALPVVAIPCATESGPVVGITAAPGVLPLTSAYSANITSNTTGCDIAQSFRTQALGENVLAVVVLTTTCPADEVLDALTLRINDRSGASITTYPGDVCIAVMADPLLPIGGHPSGPVCGSTTPRSASWSSTEAVPLPADTTYTALVVSNETGCEVEIDPVVVERSEDDVITASIQIWIVCDEEPVVSPTATGIPSLTPTATPTSTASPTSAVTPGLTPTTISIATGTAMVTVPPDDPTAAPSEIPEDSVTSTPAHVETSGDDPLASSGAMPLVTKLPTTGTGSSTGLPMGLVVAAGSLFLACGLGLLVSGRRR